MGPLDSPKKAGHQKDQVIRGLELSTPSTSLWERKGTGLSPKKTLKYSHVPKNDDLVNDRTRTA